MTNRGPNKSTFPEIVPGKDSILYHESEESWDLRPQFWSPYNMLGTLLWLDMEILSKNVGFFNLNVPKGECPHWRMSDPFIMRIFLWEAIVRQGCKSQSAGILRLWERVFQVLQGGWWETFNQRSATFRASICCIWFWRERMLSKECSGGHCCYESVQKRAFWPSRISQNACFWILEPWIWSLNPMRCASLVCGAYSFFQSLAQSSVGYLSQRHQSLAPIMLFNLPGPLSPSPPIDFGLQTFSQLTRAHLFLAGSWPYQRRFLCRFRIVLMSYCGVARAEKR